MDVDTLISAGWVLPVAPDERVVLHDHSVAVKNGKIVDVLPTSEAMEMYNPNETLNRKKSVVMPGLINAHTHTAMTGMRGKADDEPLLKWLHETIWPIEAAFACEEEFCQDGGLLATAEMIRGGVTCYSDMSWFPGGGAKAAAKSGMRALIGMIVIGFPSAYASNADEYIAKVQEVRDKFKDHSRIRFSYAPHAPYTVPTNTWKTLKELSDREGLPIHTHLHETKDECTASLMLDRKNSACHMSDNKCHPVEDFNRMGLLSPSLLAVHMVHLTDEEIKLCADKGVNVVHCPSSNGKLASGFCPVAKLLDAGVNVSLGTDSACSSNSLDLFAEMRMAALMAKNVAGDATVVPAPTAVRMATINAARALGLGEITGSLEVGKSADLICVDVLTHAGNSPVFDAHSAIVYAASRDDVSDVFVEGQRLLKDRELCTLNLQDVLKRAECWSAKIEEKFPTK